MVFKPTKYGKVITPSLQKYLPHLIFPFQSTGLIRFVDCFSKKVRLFNVGLRTVTELLVHSVSICKQNSAAISRINFCMLRNIEKWKRGSYLIF